MAASSANRSRNALVVTLLVGLVAVLFVGIMLVRRGSFQPGSVHDATIVHVQPECAYWMVRSDGYQWRNTHDVPAAWQGSVDGHLRIIDDDTAEFEAAGVSVPMWGGNLHGNPPKAFTADCPATLNR